MADNYKRLYDAVEKKFNVEELDGDDVYEWITARSGGKINNGFDRSGKRRTADSKTTMTGQSKLRSLAENIAESGNVYRQVQAAEDTETLENLRKVDVVVHKSQVSSLINTRFAELSKEEEKLVEINEQVREYQEKVDEIETLDIEEQKQLYKSGSREERELAAVALGEASPATLGGLISGERRSVGRAIRAVFG